MGPRRCARPSLLLVVLVVSAHVQDLPSRERMPTVLVVVHLTESHLLYFTVLCRDSASHHP